MDAPDYEVAVVGGGPAGLTTALYTTRLGHRTAVFEKEGGRHATVAHVHNLLGVSEAVSGAELAAHAADQLEHYGGDFYPDAVESVRRAGDGPGDGDRSRDEEPRFRLECARATVEADRVVFATGFRDRRPDVPDLERFTGRGLHYCLHCDAYTLGDAPVYVLGHGEHAARVAMTMLNFTDDVDLLLDGRDPAWDEEVEAQLAAHPVERVDADVVSAFEADGGREAASGERDGAADGGADPPRLGGFAFADGTERNYLGGFAVYGSRYNADLAAELGCELRDDGAIAVDERRETSVDGVYAVGDVTHGQNQTTIAIGDGAYAGIAIHKDLRTFPLSLEELEGDGESGSGADDADLAVPGAPPDLRARMRRLRDRETRPGLRGPSPGRE